MAKVVALGLQYLTRETISCFYLGDTLHAITASHLSAMVINLVEYCVFIAV